MRRKLILALGTVVLLAVPSCSGGSKPAGSATTVPGPNPDVVPAVITPAYVDAVFRVLNHINSGAARLMASEHQVTPAAEAELRAIFNDPVYATELHAANLSVQQGVINNVLPTGADARTTVKRLLSATRRCIFAETSTDLSGLLRSTTPAPASEYYELSPKQQGDDPTRVNPTPWAISFNAAYQTSTGAPTRCAS